MNKSTAVPNVAIVGLGAAGLSFFIQYVDACIRNGITAKILIFNTGIPARGIAYGLAKDVHLLNLSNRVMSAAHTKPDDFYLWQKQYQHVWKKRFPDVKLSDSFPPRSLFGMYLNQRFTDYCALAKQFGISVEVSTDEVVDITFNNTDENIFILKTRSGMKKLAMKILLAVGNLPSDTYLELKKHHRYFHDPWKQFKLKPGSVTAILGTRLTAIDAALQIATTDPKAKILLVSRNGQLPKIIGPSKPYQLTFLSKVNLTKNLVKGRLSLKRLGELFMQEIEHAEGHKQNWEEILRGKTSTLESLREEIRIVSTGIHRPWQSVLIAFYPLVPWTWTLLSDRDKKNFMQKYQSIWLTYLAAFPSINAQKIANLIASGQIEIISGIQKVKYNTKARVFQLFTTDKVIQATTVINATGSGHKFSHLKVLSALHKRHLVRESIAGGLIIDPSTCAVKGGKGIYAIGEITFGSWLATADLTQVSRQAALAVQDMTKI